MRVLLSQGKIIISELFAPRETYFGKADREGPP